MHNASIILVAVLLIVSPLFTAVTTFAQQISVPLVRDAATPKTSTTADTRALMRTAPTEVWQEGEPIRVKGDLKGHDDPGAAQYRPQKRRDPLLRPEQPGLKAAPGLAPTVGANFEGIPATGVLPPDTIGAVGPNHYIQMVNSAFAIYEKSGTLLVGPSQINSLFQGFGGPCETDNDGDPVVRYDHLADRWLVSQFAIERNMQCIAISRGANPVTSGWFLYAFPTLDASGQPVTPDYPKIGVWPGGYYMSTQRGFPSNDLDVWVFERDRMLAGQPARYGCVRLHRYHFSIEEGLPHTRVLLWVSAEPWRAVYETAVLAAYHCHDDWRDQHVKDIRDGMWYATRFASPQGALIPLTPQDSRVVYHSPPGRRRRPHRSPPQPLALFEWEHTG
jgi:hypothetical protein